jgi:protein-tyrosine phosphatase
MGNICRSPMAEGVFKDYLAQHAGDLTVDVDSAGTHGYHADHPPDQRAQSAAAARGVRIEELKARRVEPSDFERFNFILAMDQDNLEWLMSEAPEEHHDKIRLYLDYSRQSPGADVPDPYYGGPMGFERVLDLLQEGVEDLFEELQKFNQAANRRQ